MLLYRAGRYEEAHAHLDKDLQIFTHLRDSGSITQVNETRARALLAEERYTEARRVIIEVVDALDKAGEYALLTDALVIKGTVQARLGNRSSRAVQQRCRGVPVYLFEPEVKASLFGIPLQAAEIFHHDGQWVLLSIYEGLAALSHAEISPLLNTSLSSVASARNVLLSGAKAALIPSALKIFGMRAY